VLQRFLQNTAISAFAYGLAGVLGLFAVGVIARTYGLAILGLVVLARAFLPSGFLGMIDFGVSETTTLAVARGRIGDWHAASERVSLLALIAAITGVVSGFVLWIFAAQFAALFKVGPEHSEAFVAILTFTAAALPVAFLGLVAEGILKGFEYYGWLRLTEVSSNLAYVAAVYVIGQQQGEFRWLAYAYLVTLVAKYLVLAIVVHRAARNSSLRWTAWTGSTRQEIAYRCWLMFNSRIGGTLQQPVPPLAIGALFGPAGVGNFDLITRLPRFLKATMAPLYSAILPVSTHIDETTDSRRLQILGRSGLVLPAAVVIPLLFVVALFSEDILRIWLGPEHTELWPWLTLSLCIPAVTAMLGVGQTALIVRADFLRINTRLTYYQVLLQYLLTGLFLYWFREKAFIIGWAISYVVLAPPIAHRMLLEMNLSTSLFWEQLARLAFVAVILVIFVTALKAFAAPSSLFGLMVDGGLSCAVAWGLSILIILSPDDRAMFGRFVRAVTPAP
jgi:O-antigen/teichoic acid export membrane protein